MSFRLFLGSFPFSVGIFGDWKTTEAKNRLVKRGQKMVKTWWDMVASVVKRIATTDRRS